MYMGHVWHIEKLSITAIPEMIINRDTHSAHVREQEVRNDAESLTKCILAHAGHICERDGSLIKMWWSLQAHV